MSDTKELNQSTEQSAEQPNPTINYQELYAQERQRREDLEATLVAARIQPAQAAPGADIKPKTFEQARAQVGLARWHRMSNSDKLVALGQDPAQDLGFVRQLWGRGADPRLSADLFKSNPLAYRRTRECAHALGIFGQ
jgi:hypothetical protein